MNEWQVAQQIAFLIGAQTWPDGAAEVVFGQEGTYVTAGVAEEAIGRVRIPCCIITPIGGDVDEESAQISTASFDIVLISFDSSDEIGENALIGGPRAAGQGTSQGRGLLELQEEMLKAIGQVARQNGLSLKNTHVGATEAANIPGVGYVATRSYQVDAVVQQERFYAPVTALASSGTAPVVFTWLNPATRFDGPFELVMRRTAGATPPSSPTSGTDIPIVGLPETVSDSPGSGTFSYSLFVGYDEKNPTAVASDRFSLAATLSSIVVP